MITTLELHKKTKDLTLLFVEDDTQLLLQMQGLFSTLFKSVETAENGQLGLDAFKSKIDSDKKPYDLVISDINMPIMNGIEMVKNIYNIIPEQPIIITSAYNDADYLIELLNVGVYGFLIKPLTIDNMTKSLYTTAKAILNEELIKQHYIEIEKLNIELSNKSEELENKNSELNDKNIAIEKSMRIIEGLHNKAQVKKEMTLNIDSNLSKTILDDDKETPNDIIEVQEDIKALQNIGLLIDSLSMKHNYASLDTQVLLNLSSAISHYANTLESKNRFINLKKILQKLSATVSDKPVSEEEKRLKKIFTMIESFFFIYSKWTKEWEHISDEQFIV